MKIRSGKGASAQEAYKVGNRFYKCFPISNNVVVNAKEFESIEDAAVFLIQNPTWGIRMNPGSAIIYKNIEIVR